MPPDPADVLARANAGGEPPEQWQSRFLGKSPTDDDIKRLFEEEVQSEVNRVKTDFDPKVFTAYKEVTCQTFKDPKFRELMEKQFGKDAIERNFKEYYAAPEYQKSRLSTRQPGV